MADEHDDGALWPKRWTATGWTGDAHAIRPWTPRVHTRAEALQAFGAGRLLLELNAHGGWRLVGDPVRGVTFVVHVGGTVAEISDESFADPAFAENVRRIAAVLVDAASHRAAVDLLVEKTEAGVAVSWTPASPKVAESRRRRLVGLGWRDDVCRDYGLPRWAMPLEGDPLRSPHEAADVARWEAHIRGMQAPLTEAEAHEQRIELARMEALVRDAMAEPPVQPTLPDERPEPEITQSERRKRLEDALGRVNVEPFRTRPTGLPPASLGADTPTTYTHTYRLTPADGPETLGQAIHRAGGSVTFGAEGLTISLPVQGNEDLVAEVVAAVRSEPT
jgi:hypothetical protein